MDEATLLYRHLLDRYAAVTMAHALTTDWRFLAWSLLTVAFWAPVRFHGDLFDLLADGERPRKADWHWVLCAHFPDPLRASRTDATCVLDFAACSPDLLHVRARLHGSASVLGCPPEPWLSQSPVRVNATPLSWLRGRCAGVLPIGTESDTQTYLRDCRHGIVADSLPHAEALLKKMRRDVPALPKLMVAA